MPFKSVFGLAEKGINPEILPKPPTVREMVEDIESSSQDDPVMKFASELRRKGNGSEDEILHLDDSRSFDEKNLFTDWLIESLAVAAIRDSSNTKKSQFTTKSHVLGSSSSTSSPKDLQTSTTESDDIHGKLKLISTVCSKSEDLISKVNSKLKEIEYGCEEIIKNPNHEHDSDDVKLT